MIVFNAQARTIRFAAVLLASVTAIACGAPAPKDFGGTWMPVNRFRSAPTKIPLVAAYTFYASPMDGTLQAMLRRRAAHTDRQLAYELGSDYTLHQPVGQIRTTDLQEAVRQLSTIYVSQGVLVSADPQRIHVQAAASLGAAPQ